MESTPCPCCAQPLEVVGSRKRGWRKSSGERVQLVIRRLYCKTEKKIHHELPDILIPYKRYGADCIESVIIDHKKAPVAVEESTIHRWRSWFFSWVTYALGCLQYISLRFQLHVKEMSNPTRSILQSVGRYVGETAGWLKRIVRPIANSNLWVTDPFCMFVR